VRFGAWERGRLTMDVRLDLLDLVDPDENDTDESAYEPGWYSVLKELADASSQGDGHKRL
jgi:hypothetical protein